MEVIPELLPDSDDSDDGDDGMLGGGSPGSFGSDPGMEYDADPLLEQDPEVGRGGSES
jgi:hypothetical protein